MEQKKVLEITDMTYSYDDGIQALDHMNVTICAGERIAVVGANGAGKSTFFLCANGVLTPDGGVVYLHGKKIEKKNLNELRTHVGIVFQDADSQIIAPTVFSEVAFGPTNLKLPRNEVLQRTESSLDYMNLREFKDRAPHYLSGGEKKRVSIADIIAMEPEVIIFDEPATGLDPWNQQVLEDVLGRLSAEGKTILLSTHDMDFAYRFSDRVIVFGDGKILADDSPQAVFTNDFLLESANLRPPDILRLYRLLETKGVIKGNIGCPKTIEEFADLL